MYPSWKKEVFYFEKTKEVTEYSFLIDLTSKYSSLDSTLSNSFSF